MEKWIVNIKGSFKESPEISVVRSDNEHGLESYGWFDENKILIFGSGGPCRYSLSKEVFDCHVKTAEYLANKLNEEYNNE
ncbi:hypothetical protein VPHK359_0076 [Vibrio phage K359]